MKDCLHYYYNKMKNFTLNYKSEIKENAKGHS